ncbi:hypothetical protein AAFC00_002752 [Neodothiora populina]|uniref:Uncharacterized protein n=1 Tax=Neodothiora populina TaxID=2781224 RepID=A0ABR3P8F2_9PEZI
MSHPQPPIREPTPKETKDYSTTLHRAAILTLIVAPALAALPPRKFDAYTVGLVGLTGFSGNYLYKESRGHSIWHLIGGSKAETLRKDTVGDGDASLPTERAREFQRQMKERKGLQARADGKVLPAKEDVAAPAAKSPSIIDQVYYGSEKAEGWRERRAREDEEKLAQGKGYGDIIMEQIWDVWNWNYGDNKDKSGESEKKQ